MSENIKYGKYITHDYFYYAYRTEHSYYIPKLWTSNIQKRWSKILNYEDNQKDITE